MTDKEKQLIYEVCLKATEELGDDVKQLSWFGKNFNKGVYKTL